MDYVLAAVGGVLLVLYLLILRWARESRAAWEAEHLRTCSGCGRTIHPS